MMALVTTKLCFSASLDSSGLFAGRKQQKKQQHHLKETRHKGDDVTMDEATLSPAGLRQFGGLEDKGGEANALAEKAGVVSL
jgi:hypothetical protein